MNISGTWAGQYTFGEGYEQMEGTSVRFTLSLEQRGIMALLGRPLLVGHVRDDFHDGGMKGLATIDGRRLGRRLHFLKVMPDSGLTPEWVDALRTQFRREFHAELPQEMPQHRIAYHGHVHDTGEALSGAWTILPMIFETSVGLVSHGITGEGTWTARRTSALPTQL